MKEKERRNQKKRKGKRTGKRKGEGKGKVKEETGKGKGEEKEKKRPCLTRSIFDAKSYCFRYRFVVVRESCVCFFFFLAIIKKGV